MSKPRSDQLVTLARCPYEALPIEYRDLPSTALDQTGTFQLRAAFVMVGLWTPSISPSRP